MRRQSGVVHRRDVRVSLQEDGERGRRRALPPHPHVERPHAPQGKPAVEGGGHGAPRRPHVGQAGEEPVAVTGGAPNARRAEDRVGVAGYVLGGGVDDNVGAELLREGTAAGVYYARGA